MLAVLSSYLSSVLFRLVLDDQVGCISSLALYSLGTGFCDSDMWFHSAHPDKCQGNPDITTN
jgi:hypothetical protein